MPNPVSIAVTFIYLSLTDLELCDRIRALEAKRAALALTDPAIYEINAELNECRQALIYNRRSKRQRS